MAPTPPRASDTKGKASVTGRRGVNVQKGAPPDRRILRTQERLREAVIVSILEKGWEATSVADVCERADVARSTFYLHYADKEDLLLSGFDHLEDHLIALSRVRGELAFLEPLFEHAHSHDRLVPRRPARPTPPRQPRNVAHQSRPPIHDRPPTPCRSFCSIHSSFTACGIQASHHTSRARHTLTTSAPHYPHPPRYEPLKTRGTRARMRLTIS